MAELFTGRWIGETQEFDMPAHVWEIRQHGTRLAIDSRWEGETGVNRFYGALLAGGRSFTIGHFTAVLIDSQHFVIPGWDTNDTRGGDGPAYDVVFSRPGLAELTAHDAWEEYRRTGGRSA